MLIIYLQGKKNWQRNAKVDALRQPSEVTEFVLKNILFLQETLGKELLIIEYVKVSYNTKSILRSKERTLQYKRQKVRRH